MKYEYSKNIYLNISNHNKIAKYTVTLIKRIESKINIQLNSLIIE